MTAPRENRRRDTAVPINGAALREIRRRSGIEIADLARRVDVSRPYLSKIELGHSRQVSPTVYNRLLLELRIDNWLALHGDAQGAA